MKYLVWLWQNTRGIRLNSTLRILIGITQVALGLLMVWLSKQFIDVTIHSDDSADIWKMVTLLVSVVIGGLLLRQAYYYMTITANLHQANTIRLRIFSHLLKSQLYGEQKLHSGDITSRLERDIGYVGEATTSLMPQFIITSIQLCGAFMLMRYLDPRLAWMLLLLTPLVAVFGKLIAHKLRQMTLDIRQQESLIQMLVQEGMEHNEVLRTMGSSPWVTDRLDNMQQELAGKVDRRSRFTIITRLILGSSFSLGYLLAFVWGGLQLREGAITFGVMTSFLQLVSQIQNPIMALLNMVPQLIHTSASIDRLVELETAEAEIASSSIMLGQPTGVDINGVNFRYPTSDAPVLSQFSHNFKPGSKTAIMGITGAGKTTLFRLMLALIKPDSGSVSLYDNNGRQADVTTDTRANFVFVPQGNTLMSGTVRYNLQLAQPDATDDELLQVLSTAMADFVQQLPQGLDTQLGERGIGLSEGQAQRIAIARGLLRPGGVLLLDEISSSLDELTERQLFQRLFTAYPEKTMIFITHRPTVCELCQGIVRL